MQSNKAEISGRPRPILMIPLRRCGSHALRLRLNFSPGFYSPYPLHIVDFMPLLQHYDHLTDDRTYFQLVVDVVGLQTASMVKWDDVVFDPVSIFESIKDKPRSVHNILWEMLLITGEKHNAKIVMDKSLDSVHYAEELISLFNNILFLNVVRDPRAQISSMNRSIIHEFNTLLNTQIWVKAHDAVRKLATKYPERVLTIRFEDFVNNQEAVLRKICHFFGIDFLPNMLDISTSGEAQKISVLSTLWESNSSPPIPANIDKFKKYLSMEEIEIIETLTKDHMDYYRYERKTKANSKITPKLIARAGEESEARKKKAWEELRTNDSRDYQLRMFRTDYINMVKQRLLREYNQAAIA